ncbi:hypothetical protein [Tenuibacillus multivorans]|uniref:Uncharacterized protein n=1 Tax=Tenuibacillus multivorans TaxID=237069 RepID=A0A1H0DFM2_9BACI|nr:hypothetical protein [Tenuibacillus multivorans]GEL76574.1 hypothetical protein TMU01_08090 [Tenuibacillus multivorans]SDN68898.1 hypothetical protein SAMN05216498_2851 [Tenuibacillus multivorans]
MVLLTSEEVGRLLDDMEHIKLRILVSLKRYFKEGRIEHYFKLFEVAYKDLVKQLKRDKINPTVDLTVYQQRLLTFFLINYLNRISEQKMVYLFLETMEYIEPYYVRRFTVYDNSKEG